MGSERQRCVERKRKGQRGRDVKRQEKRGKDREMDSER